MLKIAYTDRPIICEAKRLENLPWVLLNWLCICIFDHKYLLWLLVYKLTNSEVENWFNEHSHMTVARLMLIIYSELVAYV